MTDTTKQDDEFASAFAELQTPASSTPSAAAPATAAAEAPVSPSAATPAAAEAAPAAAAPTPSPAEAGNASGTSAPATPAAGAEAGTPTAAQPAATPSPEAPAPTPAPPVTAEQFAALQAELAELKKAPPAAAPAPTPTPAEQPKPLYTEDEQGVLDAYMKEWPDVAKGEALMRRAEYQQLVQYMWNQFGPRLDALEQTSERTTTRTQYQEIKELVPDYDAVRDATLKWIDTQPAYLKAAYQQVANEGSAKDVADLITRFKKETNYAAPAAPAAPAAAPAAAAAPAPAAAAAAPAPAAAAAAAALKPVATSRSTPVSTPDPNDFDAAFKEFASAS
jgi:hypothetical protein